MKYLASVVSLKFVPNTSVWNKIIFQIYFIYLNLFYLRAIKFTQSCIAGGKWPYEEYLQKNLAIFLFLSDLLLLIVTISGAYN